MGLDLIEGSLGVGVTGPTNKVGVNGNLAVGTSYAGTETAPANGAIFEGSVGVGTPSPNDLVELKGGNLRLTATVSGGNGILRFVDDAGAIRSQLYVHETHLLRLSDGAGADKVVVDGDGDLGIGLLLPVNKLGVEGGAAVGAASGVSDAGNALIIADNDTDAAGEVQLKTGNTTRMTITNDGITQFPLGEGLHFLGLDPDPNTNRDTRVLRINDVNDVTAGFPDGDLLIEGYTEADATRSPFLSVRGSNGYIGTGTNSPAWPLHVVQNVAGRHQLMALENTSGNVGDGGSLIFLANGGANATGGIGSVITSTAPFNAGVRISTVAGGTWVDDVLTVTSDSRVGINATDPDAEIGNAKLRVSGQGHVVVDNNFGLFSVNNAGNGVGAGIDTHTDDSMGLFTGGSNERIHITANGKVGLNNTSPGAALSFRDLNTDSDADGITWFNPLPMEYGIYREPGAWTAPNYRRLFISWDTGITMDTGGQGIGSLDIRGPTSININGGTPIAPLHVSNRAGDGSRVAYFQTGNATLANGAGRPNADILITAEAAGGWGHSWLLRNHSTSTGPGASQNGPFQFYSSKDNYAAVRFAIHPGGGVDATSFNNVSDRRRKQNIESLTGALETVAKLRGVSFEWKDTGGDEDKLGRQLGFIAQEVQPMLPEVVQEDSEGFLTVNYAAIVPVLAEAHPGAAAADRSSERSVGVETG